MSNFRYLMIFISLFCSFQAHSVGIKQQNKAYRNFWHPTYNGERLDYCSLDGKECGKPIADRYCNILGYDYASQNSIAYNIGLTHFIGTRARCKGWRCNGFMTIACATHLSHNPPRPYHYRERSFVLPRFEHYRVDWCYSLNKDCGARPAHSFCSRMGYMRAKYFEKETQIGATRAIGSEQLCFGNRCEAFKVIVCYR